MFADIKGNQYDFSVYYTSRDDYYEYRIFCYHLNNITRDFTRQQASDIDPNTTYDVKYVEISNVKKYTLRYYYSTNSFTLNSTTMSSDTYERSILGIKSPLFIEFMQIVYGNKTDYSVLLNNIYNSLDNVDDTSTDILTQLQSISLALVSINNNTSTNYSQQIGQISNKIDDILSDNDTLISQNADMIEQQEQINENLEDLNDTITDDTIESTASDLPSTNVTDPTQNGINNIFQSIYNAFCIGQAQDIIFPIPFTNKSITLSPNYVKDMLTNNNATWIYTLIQAFWGYLIGRFIVYDVMKKINKIKSGDIEQLETSNIKGDML